MFKRLILAFTLFLAVNSLAAQEALPHPDQLFNHPVNLIQIHPVADNLNRTFSAFHDGNWLTLPYPDGFSRIAATYDYGSGITQSHVFQRPDGDFIVLEAIESSYNVRVWIADPTNERFYMIAPPCDAEHFSSSNPWVYAPLGENTVLCNWITGEVSPPLPEQLDWEGVSVSPDGQYLVLRGYYGGERDYRIYSYEFETQTFRVLGEIGGLFEREVSFVGWLTPTIFVMLATEMPEWSSRKLYAGDVTEINSLHFALSKLRFRPRIMLEPPSLEDMPAVMRDGPTPGPCFLEVYDALTRRTTTYDTGNLCEYGVNIPDGSGDRLYRSVYPNAAVVRFNHMTGTRRIVFRGEVERIGDVSPDGMWALIALDNNGVVDSDQDPDANFGYELEPEEYVVMDLSSGDILGRVPAAVRWLSPTLLFDQEQIYILTEDGILSVSLPGEALLALPERQGLLVVTSSSELALYSATTQQQQHIMTVPDDYDVQAVWLQDTLIQLTLKGASAEQPSLIFDVRLP